MTRGKALFIVLGLITLFIVLTLLITGCEPVKNGRANRAAHPKSTPTVSVITGNSNAKSKVGKLCRENQIGKREKDPATGHLITCKKNKKTGLPYWVG